MQRHAVLRIDSRRGTLGPTRAGATGQPAPAGFSRPTLKSESTDQVDFAVGVHHASDDAEFGVALFHVFTEDRQGLAMRFGF